MLSLGEANPKAAVTKLHLDAYQKPIPWHAHPLVVRYKVIQL
jgi:hypothetical protein